VLDTSRSGAQQRRSIVWTNQQLLHPAWRRQSTFDHDTNGSIRSRQTGSTLFVIVIQYVSLAELAWIAPLPCVGGVHQRTATCNPPNSWYRLVCIDDGATVQACPPIWTTPHRLSRAIRGASHFEECSCVDSSPTSPALPAPNGFVSVPASKYDSTNLDYPLPA